MLLFETSMTQSRYVIISPLFKKHTLQGKDNTSWFDTVQEPSVKTFYSVLAVLKVKPQRNLYNNFPTTGMQDDEKKLVCKSADLQINLRYLYVWVCSISFCYCGGFHDNDTSNTI